MGILKKIFGLNPKENKTSEIKQTDKTFDFDSLVEKAKATNEVNDLNNLYLKFFELNVWNYIVPKNCSIEEAKPFIAVLDDKPWLFVFTDEKKADKYAKTFGGFHENNGNTFIVKLTKEESLNMIKHLHEKGVIGLRINEGENGWFTDIPGLFNIKNQLEKQST